jgi:integral membrane sensor domain MASE1
LLSYIGSTVYIKVMFLDSTAFRVTAFIFILTNVFLILIKPTIFFQPDGQFKDFAFDYNDHLTVLPFSVFIYGFLVLVYIFMMFIEIKLGV